MGAFMERTAPIIWRGLSGDFDGIFANRSDFDKMHRLHCKIVCDTIRKTECKGESAMDYGPFLKSIVDLDPCAVVICNLEHEIIYMNPAAKGRYARRGGERLIGRSLLHCHNADSCQKIERTVDWFLSDREHNRMFTFHDERENKDVYMMALREADGSLIGYYEKHEYRTAETGACYEGIS